MTYRIETETDLIKALKECKDGDRISGQAFFETNHLVRHRIVFDRFQFGHSERMLVTPTNLNGSLTLIQSAEFNDCQFLGEPPTKPTTWQKDGLQCLIQVNGAKYVIMHQTDMKWANYTALWLYDCQYANLTNCHIYDNVTPKEGYGFGYGIWQGGKGNAKDQVLNVSYCSFENNRHCIAGSKHPNHIYVTGCNFKGGQYSQHILDRHGENGVGGGNYYIFGNTFEAPDRYAYDLAKPLGQILIEGNTFARPEANGRIGGVVC